MAARQRDERKLVGVRVGPDVHELLELAVMFSDDVESIQDLLEPVLTEFAREFGSEPEVAEVLKQKQRYRERKAAESPVTEPTEVDFARGE